MTPPLYVIFFVSKFRFQFSRTNRIGVKHRHTVFTIIIVRSHEFPRGQKRFVRRVQAKVRSDVQNELRILDARTSHQFHLGTTGRSGHLRWTVLVHVDKHVVLDQKKRLQCS